MGVWVDRSAWRVYGWIGALGLGLTKDFNSECLADEHPLILLWYGGMAEGWFIRMKDR